MSENLETQAGAVWFREDRVMDALARALSDAVAEHGNLAKAIAWDVNHRFQSALKGEG